MRHQLSLFVDKKVAGPIEKIREKFNPVQRHLIDSHVTLCREDEIVDIELVLGNLKRLAGSPIEIQFGPVTRFSEGRGVLLPSYGNNREFQLLRNRVLSGVQVPVRWHDPHITLLHPRNSSCTDQIFEEIKMAELPTNLKFDTISLIEQIDGSAWIIRNTFRLGVVT